jgi:hypothetical protein
MIESKNAGSLPEERVTTPDTSRTDLVHVGEEIDRIHRILTDVAVREIDQFTRWSVTEPVVQFRFPV